MRLASLALLASACSAPAQQLEDPKPPKVRELAAQAAPELETQEGLETFAVASVLAEDAITEDWPAFLGPRRDGKARETKILTQWPKGGPKLLWSLDRGRGYASPAILGDYLVYPHRVGKQSHLDCLDPTSGRRYWRFSYECDYAPQYISNDGPCATPVLEGDRVWMHGIDGKLHCLELSTGRVIWERDLRAEFGLRDQFFGVSTSPLLWNDLLVINLGVPKGPTVTAFDKNTGELVWGAGTKWGMSCASPIVATLHGKERFFVLTGGKSRPPHGGLMVIDTDGTLFAEHPFRSRIYESVNGSNPVVSGDTVMLTSSYSTGTVGIRIAKDGATEQVWRVRRLGLEFATAVRHEGDLYLVDGIRDRTGAIVCLDPATGEAKARTPFDWVEDVEIRGREIALDCGLGTGSLLHLGGDRFLCLSDNGHLLSLRCTAKGAELISKASLFRAGETWTPLVLSRGLLYVCQNDREKIGNAPPRLLCFDLRAR